MKIEKNNRIYVSPQVEIVEVLVEHGYAVSTPLQSQNTNIEEMNVRNQEKGNDFFEGWGEGETMF